MTSTETTSTSERPAGRGQAFLAIAVGALLVAVGFVLFVDPDSSFSGFGSGFAGVAVSQVAIWFHLIAAPLRTRLATFAAIAVAPWLCRIPIEGDVPESLRGAAALVSLAAFAVACLAVQEHRRQGS